MVIEVNVTGGLDDFTRNYSQWARKIQPRERQCLRKKMGERGLAAVVKKAKSLGYKSPQDHLTLTNNRQNFKLAITPKDRTGQIMRLAALGRILRLPDRELGHAMIIKDRRFSRAGVFRTLREVYNQRTARPGVKYDRIYYGRRGLMVLVRQRAIVLTRRNKGGKIGLIAVLPKRVNYKRRIYMQFLVNQGITEHLKEDAESCFRANTFRKLNKFF